MTLPDAVQRPLLRWAADTLRTLPPERVPATLRPVARFRPARRASLGAAALLQALDADAGFRAEVARYVRARGVDPAGTGDLAERAAAAQLWDHPAAVDLLAEVEGARPGSGEVAALRAEVARLTAELTAARRPVARARAAAAPAEPAPHPVDTEAVDRLRQRLRDQGSALRSARDAAAAAEEKAGAELKVLRVAHERAVAELRNARDRQAEEQARADRLQQQLETTRAADRSDRDAAHRRVELLLDTVEQASRGLRREWQLTAGGPDPAERVAGALRAPALAPVGDTASLTGLLAMPRAHLVVDGYNVTKSAWPQLTLAEQRDRLVRSLSALTVTTPAGGPEVTVVFDGASVVVPQMNFRGIRVLYSPAGVTADDVIRRLVAAEPQGRVLLVVTADREIVDSVRRAGARTVAPAALLSVLGTEPRG
ncbi:NYN domain-containing protein [Nakamurella deserti]|uniref:NYN domain-containing protein n=1 Tax=Nakamurella deserti TaxID=2164074 RepID=UPI000DBE1168|nr:NYN domain-containing protein [Nakamurella deserti]